MFSGHTGGDEYFDSTQDPNVANGQYNQFQWGGHGQHYNPNYDPTNPNSGPQYDSPSGAQEDVARYRGMGADMGNRSAPGVDYTDGNFYAGMGNQSRGLGMDSRGSQTDALGMMRSAALGNAPSVAQLQQQQGIQSALGSQMALAAGARGASGLAQAGYNAAGNTASLQRQGVADNSMLRASEMANARGAYGQMASGIRSGDMQQRGQDFQALSLMDQRSHYLADLAMRQRGLNQQGQMGYEQLGFNVNQAQLGAGMGLAGLNQQKWATQSGMDAASTQNADANAWKGAGLVTGGISGGMGGYFSGQGSGGGGGGGGGMGGGGYAYGDPSNGDINRRNPYY